LHHTHVPPPYCVT